MEGRTGVVPCLVLAAAACLPQAVAGTASLRFEVSPGFSGHYKVGGWVPLTVTVENSGPDLDAEMRIEAQETSLVLPVSLPSPSRKRLHLVVPVTGWQRELRADLTTGDKTVATETVDLNPVESSKRIVVVVGQDRSVFGGRDPYGTDENTHLVRADVQTLPHRWSGFRTVDVLWVDDPARARLEPTQLEALRRWLLLGGRLLVTGRGSDGFSSQLLMSTDGGVGEPDAHRVDDLRFGAGRVRVVRDRGIADPSALATAEAADAGGILLPDLDRALLARARPAAESREALELRLGAFLLLYFVAVLTGWAVAARSPHGPIWSHVVAVPAVLLALATLGLLFGGSRTRETTLVHVFLDAPDSFVTSQGRVSFFGRGEHHVRATNREGVLEMEGAHPAELELDDDLRAILVVSARLGETREFFAEGFVPSQFSLAGLQTGSVSLVNRSPHPLLSCQLLSEGTPSELGDIWPGRSLDLRRAARAERRADDSSRGHRASGLLPDLLARYEGDDAAAGRDDVAVCQTDEAPGGIVEQSGGSAIVVFHLGRHARGQTRTGAEG